LNSGFLHELTLNNVRATNDKEWQNDWEAVPMPKDSIRMPVVTVDTVKHFIIPIETLFA